MRHVVKALPKLKKLNVSNPSRRGLQRDGQVEVRQVVEASALEELEIAFFRCFGESPKTHEVRFWKSLRCIKWNDSDGM
jgi:hypothetical protein